MKTFQKKLLWTLLEIWIFDEVVEENHIENIFEIIKNFEEKYSRFIKWNYLWNLNNSWEAEIDDDFKTILEIAKKVQKKQMNYQIDILI